MSHELKQQFQLLESLSLKLTIGALHVDVMKLNYVPPGPDWYVPPHKHSSYEFHFITEGKGFVSMDNTPFNVGAGMLYLTGPEVVHTQLTDKVEPMAELCLQCQFELSDSADMASLQEAKQLLSILNTPVYGAVHDHFGAIPLFFACAKETANSYVGHYALICCFISEIIIAAARALGGSQLKATYIIPVKEPGYEIIQESILFLEDNYQHPISLEHVASHVHFSARHLGRMFKLITGRTINQYLTDIRMNRATYLLRHTDYSLERIAKQIGYADGSYLSQLFKRVYGYPPSDMRILSEKYTSTSPDTISSKHLSARELFH